MTFTLNKIKEFRKKYPTVVMNFIASLIMSIVPTLVLISFNKNPVLPISVFVVVVTLCGLSKDCEEKKLDKSEKMR